MLKKISKLFFFIFHLIVQKIKKNFIFFAIKGNKYDGNDFINDAIKKGAKIIIHEKNLLELKITFYL